MQGVHFTVANYFYFVFAFHGSKFIQTHTYLNASLENYVNYFDDLKKINIFKTD